MDTLAVIADLVKTVGAPTAIAVLIIIRLERRLDALTDAVTKLPERIGQWQSPQKSKPPA